MPLDDRIRLHDHQATLPVGEMAKSSCPQETIYWPQSRSPNGTLKYDELMAEHEILSEESLGRPTGGEGQADDEKNQLHS